LHSRFKLFFSFIFLTTALPYITPILPFIPDQFLGLNLTGWAWMVMLLVTLLNLLWTKKIVFPLLFWLPWGLYMVVYLIVDFSFLGLQLTLQYTLPILIGIVASGFTYTEEDLEWLLKWFIRLITVVYSVFVIVILFGSGYMPGMATMPMLLSIAISLLAAFFFITGENKYLIFIVLLFLAPAVELTRMGIAATATVFIIHFANQSIREKLLYGGLGIVAFILVFNSKPFQEKTFYKGHGTLSELTFNYYDNPGIRSSGRVSWKKALEPGLKTAPVWGNGPRADNAYLTKISKTRGGEAHNDFLSVRFNYGYIGLALLLTGFLLTFVSMYRISRRYFEIDYIWLISTSTLTLFISFLMFMYTDNILKYTIYFPNYFFALIGIVYSLKRDEDLIGYTALQ
jgi:hypothetical protein